MFLLNKLSYPAACITADHSLKQALDGCSTLVSVYFVIISLWFCFRHTFSQNEHFVALVMLLSCGKGVFENHMCNMRVRS